MIGEHIAQWTYKLAGRVVCIRKQGQLVRIGEVETITPEGDVLWLRSDGVEPRALFQKADGYTAWTLPDAGTREAPIDHVFLQG